MPAIALIKGGSPPTVIRVGNHWREWYPLISPLTDTFVIIHLTKHLDLLCDGDAGMRVERPEPNVWIPAHAPKADPSASFVVMRPAPPKDGRRLMQPNEPGIGYHEILGSFIVARRRGQNYADLQTADLPYITEWLAKVRQPPQR